VYQNLSIVLATAALVIVTLAFAGTVSGSPDVPPRSGTDGSGLDVNETATLWSKAPNECLSDAEYEERYDEARTAMQELGSCTDITFKEPPDTAERWTAYDYESLAGGDTETSIYPTSAELTDSVLIADAHATTFAVQPSTKTHLDADETVHYIAPEGKIRGLVDYRVRVDSDSTVQNHGIDEVRLRRDGDIVDTIRGTQTPTFEYTFDRSGLATLTLEADISARVERDRGNRTVVVTDRVTVSQDLDVEIYDLQAFVYHSSYPRSR